MAISAHTCSAVPRQAKQAAEERCKHTGEGDHLPCAASCCHSHLSKFFASICTITKHGLLGPRLMYSRASIPAENVQNTSRPLSGMPYLPWLRLPDHDVCKPCSFITGAPHESHNYLHLSFQTGIMHPTHRAGPSCDSGCAKLTML